MADIDPAALSENDGREGRASWFAVEGTVYDASASKLWKDGTHMRRHQAGQDLSAALESAPHGREVLERIPRKGNLAGAQRPPSGAWPSGSLPGIIEKLLRIFPFLRRHPHPLAVHFPVALIYTAFVFTVLFLLFQTAAFASAARIMFLTGMIMAPVAVATGGMSWWFAYGLAPIWHIRWKAVLSLLLLAEGGPAAVWWAVNPDLLGYGDTRTWGLLALMGVACLLISGLGFIGAKLTIQD
ncbi:MAG: DUF2231 domain-containing protein [Planctomycetota bacterium]|jgi:predicted heme/steroid binding protein/uncharacterized membrane protein